MNRKKYSDEQLIQAVAASTSIRQVLSAIGLREAGGNYVSIKNKIQSLGLSLSHFTGQACRKGRVFGPKRPITAYLSNEHGISSHSLKLRLMREKFIEPRCNRCRRKTWMNKPIPLELEHKDGNHQNNELSNLEVLCPNCHAQTSTYRGKNIKKVA